MEAAGRCAHTWQGDSIAHWDVHRGTPRRWNAARIDGESQGGLSAKERRAVQRERDRHGIFQCPDKEPDGVPLLLATVVVTDPEYLSEPFIVSTHFKKQMRRRGLESKGVSR